MPFLNRVRLPILVVVLGASAGFVSIFLIGFSTPFGTSNPITRVAIFLMVGGASWLTLVTTSIQIGRIAQCNIINQVLASLRRAIGIFGLISLAAFAVSDVLDTTDFFGIWHAMLLLFAVWPMIAIALAFSNTLRYKVSKLVLWMGFCASLFAVSVSFFLALADDSITHFMGNVYWALTLNP